MFFFTLIYYKINVVVVAVVCSFRAREPLLLLVTPRSHASASLQPCSQGLLGFQNSVAACLASRDSYMQTALLFDINADEMKKKSCKPR